MPYFVGTVDLSSGKPQTLSNLPHGSVAGFIIGNESGYTVVISISGSNSKTLYPGTVDFFNTSVTSFSGSIDFLPTANLNNISQWPSAFLQLDVVSLGENFNPSAYPLALPRTVNSLSNPPGGTASAVVNDGNASLTFVEATQSGNAIGSNVNIHNTGDLIISQYVAAVLTTLFRIITAVGAGGSNVLISDTNHQAEVLGKLLIDGIATFNQIAQFNLGINMSGFNGVMGAALPQGGTGVGWQVSPGSGNPTGISLFGALAPGIDLSGMSGVGVGKSIQFPVGSISKINGGFVSTTNAGTVVNHNFGVSPSVVFVTVDNGGSSIVGTASAAGANTVTIWVNTATATNVWWLAILF